MKHTWSNPEFIAILQQMTPSCQSAGEVFEQLGLRPSGSNYTHLKRLAQNGTISTQHFVGRKSGGNIPKTTIAELLASPTSARGNLKRRLLAVGLLKERCSACGLGTSWNGHPLSLQLDHIDGNGANNQLENLRLLCPNCHSQTPTFCGKRLKKARPTCACGATISRGATVCVKCSSARRWTTQPEAPANIRPTKISWPPASELQEMLWSSPTSTIAKSLGVSDKAIEKRAKKLGLSKPPRGYWAQTVSK